MIKLLLTDKIEKKSFLQKLNAIPDIFGTFPHNCCSPLIVMLLLWLISLGRFYFTRHQKLPLFLNKA